MNAFLNSYQFLDHCAVSLQLQEKDWGVEELLRFSSPKHGVKIIKDLNNIKDMKQIFRYSPVEFEEISPLSKYHQVIFEKTRSAIPEF